jgi:putative flippase GtrA
MKALLNQLFAALCSPTIFKMVSFAMIGVANALVDFGVFRICLQATGTLSGISTCETELAG